MATINPWKNFQALLPKASRVIGIVVSHNNNGTSTLVLKDGSTLTAKSQNVTVDRKVLVENGEIIREVPSLPTFLKQV